VKVAAMQSDLLLTTFPDPDELQKALIVLENLAGEYEMIIPKPPLTRVALPALVMSREVRGGLETAAPTIIFSGWVDYRASRVEIPDGPAPQEPRPDDCFRRSSVMFLGPCVADETKIRLIAHLEGDLGPVLPYLNAVISQASYTPAAETLTYMEGYRMIALYRHRITIAKADEIVDAWRTLEDIRQLAAQTWSDRNAIEPSFEIRRKPPAIEIFKRLPRTNCGRCSEPACLAFAVRVWTGESFVRLCLPVFAEGGGHPRLREPLLDICGGMGVSTGENR
jgi:ArsR family metal-binding transcriptional regulator